MSWSTRLSTLLFQSQLSQPMESATGLRRGRDGTYMGSIPASSRPLYDPISCDLSSSWRSTLIVVNILSNVVCFTLAEYLEHVHAAPVSPSNLPHWNRVGTLASPILRLLALPHVK